MKTGFPEPNAPKNVKPKPTDLLKESWVNNVPYDDRTSCYIKAGTNYGTGINQPVGHDGKAKQRVDALPMGRVATMSIYTDE